MEQISCLIGFTLVLSSIYMSYYRKDNTIFSKFNSLLNQNQKEIYQKIVYERMMIYIIGSVLGLSLGVYYLLKSKNEKYRICKFLMIIYLVKLGFYYFYPKSPLMLYSLTTKEQTDSWADIYTEMKQRWKLSLFVGLLGYLIVGSYICKKCQNK